MLKNLDNDSIPTRRLGWNSATQSYDENSADMQQSAKRKQAEFLKGPIPLPLLQKAAAQSGKALHVWLAIWHLAALTRCKSVKLSNKFCGKFAVSRDAKYDALNRLAEAGLIEVRQHPGKAPVITLNSADDESSLDHESIR